MKQLSIEDLKPLVTKVDALSDIMRNLLLALTGEHPHLCTTLRTEISNPEDLEAWLEKMTSG